MARRSPPEGALISAPPSAKKRVRICPEVTAAATECENGGRNNSDVDRRRFSLSSAGTTIPPLRAPSANGKRCVQFDFSDDDDEDEDDDDDDEAFAKSSAEV